MRVSLPPAVFQCPNNLSQLLDLLRCVIDGKHELSLTPEAVACASTYFKYNAPQLAGTYAELARKSLVLDAWTSPSEAADRVAVVAEKLGDYVADLCRPAVLVVEDQESDGFFVRAVAQGFSARRLLAALDRGWLEIVHGGGGSLARIAVTEADKYIVVKRVVALLDSDRLIPGQTTGSHAKAARIDAAGAVTHVLELREAENYVPNRILGLIGRKAEASRKLYHLKQLRPEQRGHYDMKNGFGPLSGEPKVPTEQKSLYQGLTLSILRGLRGGFGKNILKIMDQYAISLKEGDFESLGNETAEELRKLLQKISRII